MLFTAVEKENIEIVKLLVSKEELDSINSEKETVVNEIDEMVKKRGEMRKNVDSLLEDENEDVQQNVVENPQEKAEAWKKFMLNHPKYSALISNQKTLEAKITSAKSISSKAKQMKSTVEENKEKLKQRFAEIEGKDTESDPIMIDLTNKIYSEVFCDEYN